MAAADPPASTARQIRQEAYLYQRAMYHFFTGDHLSSSALMPRAVAAASGASAEKESGEKTRLVLSLLLRLADFSRPGSGADYPGLADREKAAAVAPDAFWFLEALYKNGEYESVLSISPQAFGGADGGYYFRGLSLLKLGRRAEARSMLAKVPKEDRLYPYAQVAIAQVDVIRREGKSARDGLKGLLAFQPPAGDLADRLHVLLGQVFYEDGLYTEAAGEFLKVPQASPFYREALLGMAWSSMKRGAYDEAASAAGQITPGSTYDPTEWERLAMLSYCNTKLGRTGEAEAYFNNLSAIISASEAKLDSLIADSSARRPYLGLLLKTDVPQLAAEERYYLELAHNDESAAALLDDRAMLREIKAAFMEKEREISEEETYVRNMITGLEGAFALVDREAVAVKDALFTVNKKAEQNKKNIEKAKENLYFFEGGAKTTLYERWEKALGRKVTEEERKVVRLILFESIEALQCSESPLVCFLVSLMTRGTLSGENPEMVKESARVIETISMDLGRAGRAEPISTEKSIMELKAIARRKIEKGRAALLETEKLREKIRADAAAIEAGMNKNAAELDDYLKKKFEIARYGVTDFKVNIMAGLIASGDGKGAGRP